METVNQEANEPAEKTFTQDEVNAIIAERLKRDRGERADYDELKAKAAKLDEIEEANKTELQKANERAESLQKELNAIKTAQTLRDIRDKVSPYLCLSKYEIGSRKILSKIFARKSSVYFAETTAKIYA